MVAKKIEEILLEWWTARSPRIPAAWVQVRFVGRGSSLVEQLARSWNVSGRILWKLIESQETEKNERMEKSKAAEFFFSRPKLQQRKNEDRAKRCREQRSGRSRCTTCRLFMASAWACASTKVRVCVSETQSERVSELDELRSGVGMRVTERESEQVKHGGCVCISCWCLCMCVRAIEIVGKRWKISYHLYSKKTFIEIATFWVGVVPESI